MSGSAVLSESAASASNGSASNGSAVDDVAAEARRTAEQARAASRQLARVSGEAKNRWLRASAAAIRAQSSVLAAENEKDIAAAPQYGLTDAATDRLRLTPDRLEGIAAALEEVAGLTDPVGEVIEGFRRPNGLDVTRVRVPLGVVFFIYESRPNVTADAAALCVKSGNAVILRGGKEALHSNRALHTLLSEQLRECSLPEHAVQLVQTTDRAAVGHYLGMGDLIDVTIPRGGKGLIERVAREATMPVIKHFDGICHVYIDAAADAAMARDIVVNGKCQRPGVCNAVETVLVHAAAAERIVPLLGESLANEGVEIRGDEDVCAMLPTAVPATEEDWGTEYLALTVSMKVVDSLDAAADHIARYGSGHTETIVTDSHAAAEAFLMQVDSSAVMVNASTRFNDGGELGLGAEIGISTDRFHARGPCGLRELTTYKYLVRGTGQIRT